MSELPCDAVGCSAPAAWRSAGPPPGHLEEFVCQDHMRLITGSHPLIASLYRPLEAGDGPTETDGVHTIVVTCVHGTHSVK